MGNGKSLGCAVSVACSGNHGCSGQILGDGREVVCSKQTCGDEELLQWMKGVKRVDEPLTSLEVETDVVFSEISKQFKG